MLAGIVHDAGIQDRDGAPSVIASACESFPTLVHLFADGGYAGEKLQSAMEKPTVRSSKSSNAPMGSPASSSSPGDGSWSAPSPGSAAAAVWQKTGKPPSHPPKPGSLSPQYAERRGSSQELENLEGGFGRTLSGSPTLRVVLAAPSAPGGSGDGHEARDLCHGPAGQRLDAGADRRAEIQRRLVFRKPQQERLSTLVRMDHVSPFLRDQSPRSRTPGPPPFCSINVTPAASRRRQVGGEVGGEPNLLRPAPRDRNLLVGPGAPARIGGG